MRYSIRFPWVLVLAVAGLFAPVSVSAAGGQGAWFSGTYRNLFAERGRSTSEVESKIDRSFRQLFFGDSATESVYRVQPDTTLALVEDAGLVTSSAMGQALLVAVAMDRPDVFAKLWKFAQTRMRNGPGAREGLFAWMVRAASPYAAVDANSSPDGEEAIATALFLGSRRWGMDSYRMQADTILAQMTRNRGPQWMPLVHPARRQVVLSPLLVADPYTDPGFHMPAFYRLWASFAGRDNALWAAMADTSWALFRRAAHPLTGLFPEFATFDGAPKLGRILEERGPDDALRYGDTTFSVDARRVGAHLALDWAWFQPDPWAAMLAARQLEFFSKRKSAASQYTLGGEALDTLASPGLTAANATLVLALEPGIHGAFVDSLWAAPMVRGERRYKDGLFQMICLLQVSGRFKAWGSPGQAIGVDPAVRRRGGLGIQCAGRRLTVTGAMESVVLRDGAGREVQRVRASSGSAQIVAPGAGLWIVDAGTTGSRLVVLP